jgi:hypothetical protein
MSNLAIWVFGQVGSPPIDRNRLNSGSFASRLFGWGLGCVKISGCERV